MVLGHWMLGFSHAFPKQNKLHVVFNHWIDLVGPISPGAVLVRRRRDTESPRLHHGSWAATDDPGKTSSEERRKARPSPSALKVAAGSKPATARDCGWNCDVVLHLWSLDFSLKACFVFEKICVLHVLFSNKCGIDMGMLLQTHPRIQRISTLHGRSPAPTPQTSWSLIWRWRELHIWAVQHLHSFCIICPRPFKVWLSVVGSTIV